MPSVSGLSTILFRNHNIAEAASEFAAQIFIDNLNALQLIDEDNHLLLDRQIDEEVNQEKPPTPSRLSATIQQGKAAIVNPNNRLLRDIVDIRRQPEPEEKKDTYPILVPLKNNRTAKLILPVDFQGEDLDKVTKFIDALRE